MDDLDKRARTLAGQIFVQRALELARSVAGEFATSGALPGTGLTLIPITAAQVELCREAIGNAYNSAAARARTIVLCCPHPRADRARGGAMSLPTLQVGDIVFWTSPHDGEHRSEQLPTADIARWMQSELHHSAIYAVERLGVTIWMRSPEPVTPEPRS